MKFMENMKKERKDNRGFSLVELIIVIAIMAILVGIVGTQVIPYLNRSRESKDLQILSSYSTAAVSAYSLNAESITSTSTETVDVFAASPSGVAATVIPTIKELTGDTSIPTSKMSSTDGKNMTAIKIYYNFSTSEDTTTLSAANIKIPARSVMVVAYKGSDIILDQVTSYL